MRYLLVLIILSASPTSHAIFGGGGGFSDKAIIAKLTTQIKKMETTIKTLKGSLDLQKKIQNFEQLKAAKRLSDEGREMIKLVNQTESLYRDIQRFTDDPVGINGIRSDIDNIASRLDYAKRKRDKGQMVKEYANTLVELQNLKVMSKVNEMNKKKIMSGTNDSEKKGIVARNTQILAEIEIQKQQDELKQQTIESELIDGVFQSPYKTTTLLSD